MDSSGCYKLSAIFGEFDNKPGQDRVAVCSDDDDLHLFVVNDSLSVKNASFYRRLAGRGRVSNCPPDLERIVAELMAIRKDLAAGGNV